MWAPVCVMTPLCLCVLWMYQCAVACRKELPLNVFVQRERGRAKASP